MSWKYVLNGQIFKNEIEASVEAGRAGYRFFLYNGVVYFRDEISLHVFDTGLKEENLF